MRVPGTRLAYMVGHILSTKQLSGQWHRHTNSAMLVVHTAHRFIYYKDHCITVREQPTFGAQ